MANPFVPVTMPDGSQMFLPPELVPVGAGQDLGGQPPWAVGAQQPAEPEIPTTQPPVLGMPIVPEVEPVAPVQPVAASDQAPPWAQQAAPANVSARASYSGYTPETPVQAAQTQRQARGVQGQLQAREQQIQGIANDQVAAAEQKAQAQAGIDQVAADKAGATVGILDEHRAGQETLNAQLEEQRGAANARIAQAIEAIPQTDPSRIWTNSSAFSKAALIGAAMIDGYLKPGGENGAINLAMKLADQDAQAQAQDLATARAKVGYEQTAYERMLGEHNLQRMDYLEAKTYRLESLAAATDQKAMSYKSLFTQADIKQQANGYRLEAQKTAMDLDRMRVTLHEGAANRASDARKFAASLAASERTAKAKADADAAAGVDVFRDPTNGAVIMGRDGKPSQITGTDTQKADFQTKIDGTVTFEDQLKQFQQMHGRLGKTVGKGNKIFNSAEEAEMRSVYIRMLQGYNRAMNGARASDKDLDMSMQALPFESLLSADPTKALEKFRLNTRTELRHETNGRTTGGWPGLDEALDSRTGPLPEAPEASFNPVQGVYDVRRGLASGAVPPGDSTVKKAIADIDETAKQVARGETPFDPEMNTQGLALVDDLVRAGQVSAANSLRQALSKLTAAASKRGQDSTEAGYGPVIGQGTPLPPTRRRGEQTVLGQ